MTYSFVVPSVPVPQPRQRHRIVTSGGRSFASNYTPAKHPVMQFKSDVRTAAAQVFKPPFIKGPISLNIAFIMPRPANMFWKKREMPRVLHTKKPDADNLLKAVKDALSKVVWQDDSQVCAVHMTKWIASGDESPKVEIEITEMAA